MYKIELYAGPLDGQEQVISDLHDEVEFPIIRMLDLVNQPPDTPIKYQTIVYRKDTWLNDHIVRYSYQGTRERKP